MNDNERQRRFAERFVFWGGILLLAVLTLTLVVVSRTSHAQTTGTATVSWTPPVKNTDGSTLTDLAGYTIARLKKGNPVPEETITIPNPAVVRHVFQNLPVNTTHCFYMTAFNSRGVQSSRTNEVCTDGTGSGDPSMAHLTVTFEVGPAT